MKLRFMMWSPLPDLLSKLGAKHRFARRKPTKLCFVGIGSESDSGATNEVSGAPYRTRTDHLRFTRALLYQMS